MMVHLSKGLHLTCVFLLYASIHVAHGLQVEESYKPNWDSLDKRPLPKWYDEAKVGIFIHWGIFSVPSFESEWFWWLWKGNRTRRPSVPDYMRRHYAPDFVYTDFAREFRAEFFDPNQWAGILARSGARYVVLTAKHHEGFCNWPSSTSWPWNSMHSGPRRDLVGELEKAVRAKTKLRFGLYHSLFEWFNPLYLEDKKANFTKREFVTRKVWPEMQDLVERYRPDIFWSDGDNGPDQYWRSTDFLAWLYNTSPIRDTVVTNDRWGDGCPCKHGGFYTCLDHYRPEKLISHKWENCLTIDRSSWGFRREAALKDFLSIHELIYELVSTVAFGGNILINVGPTAWGTIPPIYEERLTQLGSWLYINGVAIYGTQPWKVQHELGTNIWYTSTNSTSLPPSNISKMLKLKSPSKSNIKVSDSQPMFRLIAPQTIVYAVLTSWSNRTDSVAIHNPCGVESIYLSAVRAQASRSEFYLLDGASETGKRLDFQAAPHGRPGVNITLPKDTLWYHSVPLSWACVIRMLHVG